MSERPYSRLYWQVVDDERFAKVFDDDHHWATYTRLLMCADAAWPVSAQLPANARRASVKALMDAGIIEMRTGARYRIHGMAAERSRREEHNGGIVRARDALRDERGHFLPASAGNQRWQPAVATSASSSPIDEPRRAEPSQDEEASARASMRLPAGWIELCRTVEDITGQAYPLGGPWGGGMGGKARGHLERYGLQRTAEAYQEAGRRVVADFGDQPVVRQLVLGAEDILAAIPRGGKREPTDAEVLQKSIEATKRRRAEREA